jgi:DNA-binding beta-propeller fold protein YncE
VNTVTNKIYVPDEYDSTITVIDGATNSTVIVIKTVCGFRPPTLSRGDLSQLPPPLSSSGHITC